MPNIIQAEFFLVDGTNMSVSELLDEAKARTADGVEIKKVLRFYDVNGNLTELVLKAAQVDKDLKEALMMAASAERHRWFQGFAIKRLASTSIRMHNELLKHALESVRDTVHSSREIAIEDPQTIRFRFIERAEVHELLESIEKSPNAWVSVYKPHDLCSEDTEMIAMAM